MTPFIRSTAFSKSKRGSLIAAVALASAVALSLTSCSSSGGQPESGNGAQEVLHFGLSADPAIPITGMQQGAAVNQLLTMVHRGLMTYGKGGALEPALAEKVDTPDPTTYVFTLREGLKFHDGAPLTGDNVKASLEYYRDPANGSLLAGGLNSVKTIDSDGDRIVTVTLNSPNTAFLQYLALPFAAIVPDASLNPDTPNWIGAGPFEMANLDEGIGITMTKNADFYGADQVELSEIDVKFYPDGEARTNALLSGDVDLIEYVPWENFDRVSDAGGFTVDAQNGPFQYVQFNVEDGPFAKPEVRQAVAYALNRENAVKAAFQSHGAPLAGLAVAESDPAFSPESTKLWSDDVAKAKQLLSDAGYADGFSATLLTTSQYTFLQDTALSVQADLKEIGIDVKLDAPDWSTRVSKGNAGEYDLAVSGDTGVVTDPSYLRSWVVDSRNFNASWGYKNETITKLLDDGLKAENDSEKHEIYQKVYAEWAKDVPFATINTRQQAFAFRDGVSGFENLPGFLTFYSGYSFVNTSVK